MALNDTSGLYDRKWLSSLTKAFKLQQTSQPSTTLPSLAWSQQSPHCYKPRSTFRDRSISAQGIASLADSARLAATLYGLVRPCKALLDLGGFADA